MVDRIDWTRELGVAAVVVAAGLAAALVWGAATGSAVALMVGIALTARRPGRCFVR